MRSLFVCLCSGMILSIAHASLAGPPGGKGREGGPPDGGGQGSGGGQKGAGHQKAGGGHKGGPPGQGGGDGQNMMQQIMALDTDGDGILTPAEVTDPRLQPLLQQADTDASGSVTFAELTATLSNNGRPGTSGQGGGPGGSGGPPRPGEILPGFLRDQLQLSDAQRQQLATLQAQVDAQLMQILTTQQLQQLSAGPQNGGQRGTNGPGGGMNGPGGPSGQGRKGRSSKNVP